MGQCKLGHQLRADEKFCGECGSGRIEVSESTVNSQPGTTTTSWLPNTYPADTPVHPEPVKTNSTKKMWMVLGGIVAAALLVNSLGSSVPKKSVEFTLTVYTDDGCNLSWGYFNIPSMDVDLFIDGEFFESQMLPAYGYSDSYLTCTFTTYFSEVPANGDLYEFRSDRGDLEYTRTDLETNDWVAAPTLGL